MSISQIVNELSNETVFTHSVTFHDNVIQRVRDRDGIDGYDSERFWDYTGDGYNFDDVGPLRIEKLGFNAANGIGLDEIARRTGVLDYGEFITNGDFFDPVIVGAVHNIKDRFNFVAFHMLFKDRHSRSPNHSIYLAYSMLIPNTAEYVQIIQAVRYDPSIVVRCFQSVFPQWDQSEGELRLRYISGGADNPGELGNSANPLRYQDFLVQK